MGGIGYVRRLIDQLNAGTELNPEGAITFRASDFEELFFLLADCIVYPRDVTRADMSGISYRAFIDLRKTGPGGLELGAPRSPPATQSAPRPSVTFVTFRA